MPYRRHRKLNIDLPQQPLVDQRPWLITGLILGAGVLLMILVAYIKR